MHPRANLFPATWAAAARHRLCARVRRESFRVNFSVTAFTGRWMVRDYDDEREKSVAFPANEFTRLLYVIEAIVHVIILFT